MDNPAAWGDWLRVLNPVLGLGIHVGVQILSFRWIPRLALLKSVMLGFAAGTVWVLLFEGYLFRRHLPGPLPEFFGNLATNLLIFAALGYCYFHFVNLGETARRIRIVRELEESPDGLTLPQLLERYNARMILRVRVRRLVDNGQLILREGRYFIGNPTLLLISRTIRFMKKFLLGKKSEFD